MVFVRGHLNKAGSLRQGMVSTWTVMSPRSPTEPPDCPAHLCVGHVHARGIEPVLYLLGIVHLQQVIASELHICELLVVLKEVNGEVHLAGCASCWKGKESFMTEDVLNRQSCGKNPAGAIRLPCKVFLHTFMEPFYPLSQYLGNCQNECFCQCVHLH